MKYSKLGACLLASIATTSFAVNPVEGIYIGFGGGISYLQEQKIGLLTTPVPATVVNTVTWPGTYAPGFIPPALANASLNYGILGDFFFHLGYRLSNFRVEGEFLYNTNQFDALKTATPITVTSLDGTTTVIYPTKMNRKDTNIACVSSVTGTVNCNYTGRTSVMGGMANFYYDFINFGGEDSSFAPYAGFGIGFTQIETIFKLKAGILNNTAFLAGTNMVDMSLSKSTVAAQGMIGFNYFMDDFTAFFMDYRYVGAGAANNFFKNNYGLHTLNAGFNLALDKYFSDLT
jgi:hypothetical protein